MHYQTVQNHRNRHLDWLEGVNESARSSRAIIQVVREHGTAVMSEGMLTTLEQVLFEQVCRLRADEKVPARELAELTKSVTTVLTGRETMESIRREHEEAVRKAAAACEAAAKRGASGKDVVARMREILGV
jgi:hypothetical protein